MRIYMLDAFSFDIWHRTDIRLQRLAQVLVHYSLNVNWHFGLAM